VTSARSRAYLVTKRCFDLAVCVLLLPLFVVLFALCAAALKLEDRHAPAMFAQLRTGKDGKRFRMLKFRTMVQNAEQLKQGLAPLSVVAAPDFKLIDDPRVTPVGRVLRKTSLDELPQIANIIRGEMSLVGPRPTSFAPSTYAIWQTYRLEVKPGLTGLWQVKGRNRVSFDERLRLDIEYIRQMSLRLDLKILWWTAQAVFTRSGA